MRRYTLAALVCLLPAAAHAQQRVPIMSQDTVRGSVPAAQAALRTFARLVNASNYRSLGFDNPEQVTQATLGSPLQQLFVQLDDLRQYQPTQRPESLFRSTERVLFPVQVQSATRSSLTVARREGQWNAHGYGDPSFARSIDGLRVELARREAANLDAFFELRVPALNVVFLGLVRDQDVRLFPVLNDARFGFERGASLPANEALGRMVEAARQHNGLPT